MGDLNISKRQVNGVTVVDLAGKIALGESNRALHDELRELAQGSEKNILVNLRNVTLIDSSGLGELVAGYASIEKSGGTMKLTNLPDRATELMTITKLYTVFDVFDNEADAVSSFRSGAEASA
jgi:anti-sigma B factor antagonist